MRRTPLLTILFLFALALPAVAQTTPKRVRGTVQSLNGQLLTVLANDGQTVKIVLAPNYTVGAIVPSTLDKVTPGAKIGIVGFGPPKQQRAAVISIVPPGATMTEAQFAWDTQPDSVMTNGSIASEVTSADGRTLMVAVKGEPVQVTVPANAIIQESAPGDPSMLTPGAHVLIAAQQAGDGTVTASRVNVGRDGWTPAN